MAREPGASLPQVLQPLGRVTHCQTTAHLVFMKVGLQAIPYPFHSAVDILKYHVRLLVVIGGQDEIETATGQEGVILQLLLSLKERCLYHIYIGTKEGNGLGIVILAEIETTAGIDIRTMAKQQVTVL